MLAIRNLTARPGVIEHKLTRILLPRFAVVPQTKHWVRFDEQPSNVRSHPRIRKGRQLTFDQSLQNFR